MAGEGKRTYRRAPGDLAEATFIHDRIAEYLSANTVKLATDGEHDRLHDYIGYERAWRGIVRDLSTPPAPTYRSEVRHPGLGVHIPAEETAAAKDDGSGEATALGEKSEPEGGTRSRRTPK